MDNFAKEGQKSDFPALVCPDDGVERLADGYLDAEFLTQLADQGLGRGLRGFHFSAGKLPQTCEVFVARPSACEKAALVISDHPADDINHGF